MIAALVLFTRFDKGRGSGGVLGMKALPSPFHQLDLVKSARGLLSQRGSKTW